MLHKNIPNIFKCLLSDTCIDEHDILGTSDGFYMVYKSIANIHATKSIFDFPDSSGESFACESFSMIGFCMLFQTITITPIAS